MRGFSKTRMLLSSISALLFLFTLSCHKKENGSLPDQLSFLDKARQAVASTLTATVFTDLLDFSLVNSGGFFVIGNKIVNHVPSEFISRVDSEGHFVSSFGSQGTLNLSGNNAFGIHQVGSEHFVPYAVIESEVATATLKLKKVNSDSVSEVTGVEVSWDTDDFTSDTLVRESALWVGFLGNSQSNGDIHYSVKASNQTSVAWSGTYPEGTASFASGPILAQSENHVFAVTSGSFPIAGSSNFTNKIQIARLSPDGSSSPVVKEVGQTTTGTMLLQGAAAAGPYIYVWGIDGLGAFATRIQSNSLTIDSQYGSGGFAGPNVKLAESNANLVMDSADVDKNGKLLACGRVHLANASATAVWRIGTDGKIDRTFGTSDVPFWKLKNGDAQCFRVRSLSNGGIAALFATGYHDESVVPTYQIGVIPEQ